mmetsp:Transcript_29790/g.63184  ORF Transcript_29790/g.63184 Transcript_29790/m.63184 type:complete len:613 (+) Transcript_29790:83-1921(+)
MKLRPMQISKASLFLSGIRQSSPFSLSRSATTTAARRPHCPSHVSSMMSTFANAKPTPPLYTAINPNYTNDDAAESSSLKYTPLPSIAPLVDEARQIYSTRITHSHDFRMEQLRGIEKLVQENSEELSAAIAKDLGQGPMYCEAFELSHVLTRSRYAQSHLKEWMATKRTPTPFPVNLNIPVHSELAPNPRGVALIITPWNLPIQLTLNPLIDALSAGNVCVLKMSERSVHCTKLFTDLFASGKYVDSRVVKVVNGGAEESTELLKQRVDVISYTGGGQVGRIVASAAAKQLIPVLLELGGKNPVFVTKNAHIPSAALRVAWGKISANTGQMCICPDFCLVDESVKEEFTNELFKVMDRLYPVSTYEDGGDVGKMITVQHAERVVGLLDSTCNVIYGGKHHNVKERFVAPTVVEATADSKVMKEEIFGPILAIVTVPSLDGAIEFFTEHYTAKAEHPLALYIFSKSKEEQKRIMAAVPSGTCGVNEVIKQAGNHFLPFGGVGTSGMGAYYGKYGFDFFSHYRGTLVGNNYSTLKWDPSVWLVNPPFNQKKLFAFRCVGKVQLILDKLKSIIPVAKVVVPIGFASVCFFNPNVLDALLELNLKTIFKWVSQMM